MKLDKAIELSEIYLRHPLNNMTPDEKSAHKLGIEALKAWCKYQAGWVGDYKPTLPGGDPE